MIDPKLNEIPVKGRTAADPAPAEAERSKGGRTGLSINETIAGDTVLSSGSRGVDTSGVSAGAGAAAGSSVTTPGRANESPAPNIVPGGRGSGTTVRSGSSPTELAGSSASEVFSDTVFDVSNDGLSSDGLSREPNTMEVAERAYHIWFARGCPAGTAEEDWHQAEHELVSERARALSRAATI